MAYALPELPAGRIDAAEDRISERIAHRCMSLMVREFQRAPIPVLCADAFIAYLAIPSLGKGWPWIWFVVGAVLQLYRYMLARRLDRTASPDARDVLHQLTRVFGAIGLSKAIILPAFFVPETSPHDAAFLVTMVVTGLAAGGVASAAGRVSALVAWGAPLFGCLIVCWAWKGTTAGWAVAALLALLFAILLAFVRDQRGMIEELVRLVDDRETLSSSLQVERDRAQLASEGKTRFFAAASHDLRQPLHALSINATTLAVLAQRSQDAMLKDVSRGIAGALQQSQSLLDGLLDISRLDANAVQTSLAPLDLRAALQATLDEYEALAAQKSLTLDLMLPSGPIWVVSDIDQLSRVIGNLVNNALKFTQRGRVELSVALDGSYTDLRIKDTGPGIRVDEHAKVFEEFYQGGNSSRDRAQGLGLGLAIVKRTCELLHIQLSMKSTVDSGTTFLLRLETAAVAPKSQTAEARIGGSEKPEVYSVLVIDDEIQVVESVDRYLTAMGWTVKTGASSADAIAAMTNGFLPDVLAVDYRLKDQTGLDVIARVRMLRPFIPAVIITGDTDPQRLRELSAQASGVLHKPVNGERLAQALLSAIQTSQPASRIETE